MVKFNRDTATPYLRVAEERADVNFCSLSDVLAGFAQAGFIFDKSKKIAVFTWKERDERRRIIEGGEQRDYMIIGEFNDKGNLVPNTQYVRIGISEKIDFKPGLTASQKFKEIYQNYVIFFGSSVVDNRPYLTAAPEGNGNRAMPESIDFTAFISKDLADTAAPAPRARNRRTPAGAPTIGA